MAPIDFEESIRKRLEDREIQPSKEAWDKLEAQLGGESAKRTDKRWLFYVAAAMLAGVLFWVGLSNQEKPIPTPEQLVEESVNEEQIQEEMGLPETQIEVVENTPTESIGNTKSVENKAVETKVTQEVLITKNSDKEPLKDQMLPKSSDFAKQSKKKEIPEALVPAVEDKVQEVLLAVQRLEQTQKTSVTDAELDSLLMQARNEILADRVLDKSNKVDAVALLNEAEYELDRSFRDKVFEALKTGYTKVKTAVADRD